MKTQEFVMNAMTIAEGWNVITVMELVKWNISRPKRIKMKIGFLHNEFQCPCCNIDIEDKNEQYLRRIILMITI
jgi:hypothetical protein